MVTHVMGDQVRWADRPPPPHGYSGVKLWCCPPKGKYLLRSLGPPRGVWQHFLQGSSCPCVGPACRICPDPKLRWTAYLPSELWTQLNGSYGWLKVASLITPRVYFQLKAHGWRGTYFSLERREVGGFRELHLAASRPPAGDQTPLSSEFDPLPIAREVWLRRWPMLEGLMGIEHSDPPAAQGDEDVPPAFVPVKPAETPPEPTQTPETATQAFLDADTMKARFRAARNGKGGA